MAVIRVVAALRWLLVLAAFVAVSAAGGEVVLPDAATGVIAGTIALLLWPTTVDAGHTPLPADGCDVHVAPTDSLTHELILPCKEWFQPPGRGRYLVWLEQGTTLSPQTIITFDYIQFHGRGQTILMPMKPAGWLKVNAQLGHADDTVRILSLETAATEPRAFDRMIPPSRASSPTRVPAGMVIAGIFDSAGRAQSLARPVTVRRGETATAVPQPPRSGSDVLVSLARRKRAAGVPCRAELVLGDGTTHPADAKLESWDRVVTVWYGATGADGRVVIECSGSKYEKPVKLAPKSVLTMRDELP